MLVQFVLNVVLSDICFSVFILLIESYELLGVQFRVHSVLLYDSCYDDFSV